MQRLLLICGIATALLVSAGGEAATLRVCNKAHEDVRLAFGYEDRDLGPLSEAWWRMGINDCVDIVAADQTDHQYYFDSTAATAA
ncbi:MAG TPA: DUF1036 domain-containing protein [Xanthobacteraceae bacterium]|nr:DUF1036 domain-containing protein [Xanthobacteraceae bacterium]